VPAGKEGYYIGIDLGGTWTKVGLSDSSGCLLARHEVLTEGYRGPGYIVGEISKKLLALVEEKEISGSSLLGVGVGSPGPLDIDSGTILKTPNLGWEDVPLRDILSGAVGLQVALDNDANAAALGEWWKGAGAGSRSLVCFTLGTGVGGGIVIDGEIWHGSGGVAGELGHMTIEVNGRRCNCGNSGCLEAYASATAISERAREGLKGCDSGLSRAVGGDLDKITSEIVYRQAVEGDPFCRRVIADTAVYLAVGIANMLNILNPEVVVIGGGVTQAGRLLFDPLLEEVGKRAFPSALRGTSIVPAGLGNDAGMVGAVGLIKKEVEGELGP